MCYNETEGELGTGGVSDYDKGLQHAMGMGEQNPADAHKYAQGTGGVSGNSNGGLRSGGGNERMLFSPNDDEPMYVGDREKPEDSRPDDYAVHNIPKGNGTRPDDYAAMGYSKPDILAEEVKPANSGSRPDDYAGKGYSKPDIEAVEVEGEEKPIIPTQSLVDDMFNAGGAWEPNEGQSELLYNSHVDLIKIKTVLQKYENVSEYISSIDITEMDADEANEVAELGNTMLEEVKEETGFTYDEALANLDNIEDVIEEEEYTLAVQGRIDEELGDTSQISLVDWTNINDPEMVDEEKEKIMDADLEDLNLSELVSRVEYDFETLLKEMEKEVIGYGLEEFNFALQRWEDGEDWDIKQRIFDVYGEHVPLEDINLNDLRNDYLEHIWTSNQIDERFTNRVNEHIIGRIEPYLLDKTNLKTTDEGYSFEIPPNFADYMVAYSEAKEEMLEQQGQDITTGGVVAGGVATAVTAVAATTLTAATGGVALVIALIVGAIIGIGGAVWGNHVASDKEEWDAIADHIKDHEITDSNLVISVTYEDNGDTGILINDREE